MRWNVGTKIGATFGLALAVFLIVGLSSYRSTVQLTETAAWVAHTHQVLEALERAFASLTKAESAERGYIISGDERYLQDYQEPRTLIAQRTCDVAGEPEANNG